MDWFSNPTGLSITGTGCREPYLPTDRLERDVGRLYQHIQISQAWAEQLDADLNAEIAERRARGVAERDGLRRDLAKLDGERRKPLEASYAEAISLDTCGPSSGG